MTTNNFTQMAFGSMFAGAKWMISPKEHSDSLFKKIHKWPYAGHPKEHLQSRKHDSKWTDGN